MKPETKKCFDKETHLMIETLTRLADELRDIIRGIDNFRKKSINKTDKRIDKYNSLSTLSEYSLLLSLVHLDIACAYRVYINAKEKYEVIYSTKQLVVTVHESFKKIYHFNNSDGQIVSEFRKNSFWMKEIYNIINKDFPESLFEYNAITDKLESFIDIDLKDMKPQRDLIVHYDKIPSKVYDTLINLDIEIVSLKILPFLKITQDMIEFSKILLLKLLRNRQTN